MNIELHEIAVRDLVAGYEDKGDEGVVGYGGKLDIRPGCAAYKIASSYMDGSPIRQDYLETALRWIGNGADPRFYMALHQHDPNANPLWLYFQQVVNWAKATFPVVRAPMKKVPWGLLYNKFAEVPQHGAGTDHVAHPFPGSNLLHKCYVHPAGYFGRMNCERASRP